MGERRTTNPLEAFTFVPGTRVIDVGRGVVYRPLRSWHSGVFAGERLVREPGEDKSGCIIGKLGALDVCMPPYSYTHRLYWNVNDPEKYVSCFLSYPNGMGPIPTYFWEVMLNDVERFDSEEEAEEAIRNAIGEVRT